LTATVPGAKLALMSKLGLFVALVLCVPPAPTAAALQSPAAESLEQLEAAAKADSNDAELLYRLGVAYARAGRKEEAKQTFTATVRVDPQFALGYVALAQFYQPPVAVVVSPGRGLLVIPRRGSSDSSSLLLRRAFQINPFIEHHQPGVVELPMYWRGTLQQALRHYHDGKLPVALEEFGSVIERTQKPDHPEAVPPVALWYHILTAIQLQRYDDAIRDGEIMLDAALRLDTTGTSTRAERLAGDIQYLLANLQFAGGHTAEAERLYRLVVEGDLGWYMAHAKLAQLYESQGRLDEAVGERRSAVDANPDDPSLVLDLGRTLVSAGRLPEADSVLERAVVANPRQTEALYSLGIVASRLGRSVEARAVLTRFLELAPSRYTEMIRSAKAQLAALQ